MKIIVGLGNPGKKYQFTRHNVGWLTIDFFLKNQPVIECKQEFEGEICSLKFHSSQTYFVKPLTFMNDSGKSVKLICKFYKIDLTRDLLVIHDDTDLPFETWKITKSSRSAGHNGVQSIINELGTQDFHRLRIGVETREKTSQIPTDLFVLSSFSSQELHYLENHTFKRTNQLIQEFIEMK